MQSRIDRLDTAAKVVIVEMGNTKLQSLVMSKLNAELCSETSELWSLVCPTLNSPDYRFAIFSNVSCCFPICSCYPIDGIRQQNALG